VAGCVGHAEAQHLLAAAEDVNALLGNRQDLAPEAAHVLAVEAPGARQQLGGVDEVRGAALVHVDLDIGPAPQQGAGAAGVVEVDVGEQNGARGIAAERVDDPAQARLGPGVHQDVADLPAADHPLGAQVGDVDQTGQWTAGSRLREGRGGRPRTWRRYQCRPCRRW
jgi:hypothetical protein